MKNKTIIRVILAILAVALLCTLQFMSSSDERTTSHGSDSSNESPAITADDTGFDTKLVGLVDTTTPKAVATTLQVGVPEPTIPFPRGVNQRRRYNPEPVTRQIPADLIEKAPTQLALLPADGRTTLTEEETDSHTLRAKRMVFVPASIQRVIDGETSRILVPTVDDQELEVIVQSVKTRAANTHTLHGKVKDEAETSDVILVYHDGILHGTVARYNIAQHLEYRILEDGYMMVREIDQSTMTAVCGDPGACDHSSHAPGEDCKGIQQELESEGIHLEPAGSGGAGTAGELIAPEYTASTVVDVVVGYGQQARIAQGGYAQIEALIIAAVDRMNLAFSNSLITDSAVMLLGTIEDPDYIYPGAVSGSMSTDDELGNLNNMSNGALDTVSNYATELGADLKSFVMKDADGSAGIAYRPGKSSVVARTYMSSNALTFAHELGHSLGANHSWGDAPGDVAYHSRYGWRIDLDGDPLTTTDRVRTIMSYDWAYQRVLHYSNPSVSYNGIPTGAVDGYNVQGNPNVDQRYYQGGYGSGDSSLSGFDGTNPSLGARNAENLLIGSGTLGIPYASNRATRTNFNVVTPVPASTWQADESLNVYFLGGDHTNTASVDLYKGADLVSNIASGINPATGRDFSWNIPLATVSGSDYMVRVTLSHPVNGTITSDSGIFTIIASPTNVAPVFVSDPFAGSDATEDLSYADTISASATDANGDVLTYAKISGPNWLSVATDGTLSGTPTNSEVGTNAFTVSVSDGTAAAVQATLNIVVLNTNDAPTWTSNPINVASATEDAVYSGSIAGSATDVDAGAVLTFEKDSGPAWLSVAANGVVSGTPSNGNVGANSFTVSVSDGIAAPVQATLDITVINTNDAPTWTSDPINLSAATANTAYSDTIAGGASDVDAGSVLTYSKVSGLSWLSVAANGTLSGTPTSSDVGNNSFTVSVSDGIGTPVTATLNITVEAIPSGPALASGNLAIYQKAVGSTWGFSFRPDLFATDGIASNFHRWRSTNTSGQSLEISYPRPVAIASAHLYTGVIGSTIAENWANFKLQYHNGTTWTDIPGGSRSSNTSLEVNVIFSQTVTSDKFRLLSTDAGSAVRSIRELAMFGSNSLGGVEQGYPIGTGVVLNLAHKLPATASSINGTNYALKAVDGYVDDSSRWLCTEGTAGEILEIDLLSQDSNGDRLPAIGSAHLYSGDFATSSGALSDFALEYWNAGTSAWVAIPGATITGNTANARVITFSSSVVTNRVRLVNNTTSSAKVAELLLFPPRTGGYALGQDVRMEAPPTAKAEDFGDATRQLRVSSAGLKLGLVGGNGVFTNDNAGQDALDWQLLLNHSDGSYRIRNVMSGNCLALAGLSMAPDTLVVGETYTGMPHQRWFIVFSNATQFSLRNAYSGLALQPLGGSTSPGASLAVVAPGSSPLQLWDTVWQSDHMKKGIAATGNAFPDAPADTWMSYLYGKYLHTSWSYSWGRDDTFPFMATDHTFNPMQWGNYNWAHSSNNPPLEGLRNYLQFQGKPHSLLGFNEPDGVEQANMTVARSIELWPRLQSMDVPLVGPCPANPFYKASTNQDWNAEFYAAADQLGYRVDYTPYHWYASPNASNLINNIKNLYNLYGRPIWLTEFSTVRWSGTTTWTHAQNYNFLAEFMWRAENLPELARYSLFNWKHEPLSTLDTPQAPRGNSLDENGNLTPYGELYASWDGVAQILPQKAYHLHNYEYYQRMQSPVSGDSLGFVTPDDSTAGTQWFLTPGNTANTYQIKTTRDGRPLVRTSGNPASMGVAGQLDSATEWTLVPVVSGADHDGWYYLQHPLTNQRLKNNGNGTCSMVATTDTTNASKWRFIVPMVPDGGTTPPLIAGFDIAGNQSGGTVPTNTSVIYSLTFSEDIDASTVTPADFGNAGTAAITIGAITEISPGVFTVEVTPTSAGSLILRINAGAAITDVIGNPVDTAAVIYAGSTLNVEAAANNPPTWAANPVAGANATEDAAYSGSLSGSASDVDAGATLTFAKESGPAWLSVASNGALSGTPTNSDVGANSFTVSVSDGIAAAVTATLNITVTNTNDAPTWAANPVAGADATEDAAYIGTLEGSASDADAGATLTFAKVSGPAWLGVSSDGTLSGTPTNSDVGANAFTVSVSDGVADPVTATLSITVTNTNDAPTWAANPVAGANASVNSAYTGTLEGSASDMDAGAILTFAKVSGPAWLGVASDGTLSGTPTSSDVGANSFTVSVNDGIAPAASAGLDITVDATIASSAVIYEPFADSDSTLPGNTPGTGLAGTWSGSGSNPSITSNMTYGTLSTTGNAAQAVSGWVNNQVSIDIGNPEFSALKADGGDMWFSVLFAGNTASVNSAYSRFALAIGSSNFTSNGDLASGQAIGFASASNHRLYAGLWKTTNWGSTNLQGPPETAVDPNANGSYQAAQTCLIVGHVQWGANNATDPDTVTLYLPGSDLELGTAVASSSGITDQSAFNKIMTHNGNVVTNRFDEIRVGATYASVVGASGSGTPGVVDVPDVVGLVQATAEANIVAANLVVGAVTSLNDAVVPAGDVIGQSPVGSTSVAEGSSVDLVISLGPVMTTVPNVVGLAQATAESNIVAANLVVGIVSSQNDATVPAGDVISQSPVGSTSIAEGSSVDLVISLGPVMTSVPNVVGLAQATAEANIVAANLVVGAVTSQNDAVVPAGDVITQSPVGTTSVAEGSSVDLVISLGPVMTTVPNVVGLAQATAESNIVAANLVVGIVSSQNDATVPVGDVISQSPVGSTSIAEGSSVDLVISLGPVMTSVPNVVGLAQATAEANIVAANLAVGAVTSQNDAVVPAGDVISQSPVGTTSVAEGSSVDLVISLGPVMTSVPNVVGLAQATAESNIVAANLVVGIVSSQNDATVPAGDVISQSPVGSTSIAEGSSVDLVISTGPVIAGGIVFSDDFEAGTNIYGGTTQDVSTYTIGNTSKQTNTTLWVRSSSGYGSDRSGLIDESESGGANFTDPSGEQAYGFRYTNTGLTTAEGMLGALTSGTTIDVSFDVAMDGFNSGTNYDAMLVLFDTGVLRNTVRIGESNTAAVLARSTGSVAADGNYYTVNFSYVVGDPVFDNDGGGALVDTTWLATLLGKDIGLRFKGQTTCANIDNVIVTVNGAGGGDTTPPTLATTDIVDGASGGPVTENTAVNYTITFSEDMHASTVDVTDFGSAGTSAITVDSVVETGAAVFSVTVTPTTSGNLQLQVNTGSVLKDVAGNSLDTTAAIVGDTVIMVNAPLTTVPNVVGLAQSTAETNIVAANLVVGAVTSQNDAVVPVGDVISQSPVGSTSIAEGSSVDLVISLGQATTTVPNVVGLAQAAAEADIVAADLVVGTVTQEYSATVTSGDVISQGLTSGASVPTYSLVDLVISLGMDPSPKLVRTSVSSVSNGSWTTVDLGKVYNSLVVVATPIYPTAGLPPVVTRITNVTSTGFDVKIDRADGLTDPVSFDVSIIAVDEGVYTQAADGVTMEAVKYSSTVTAYKGSWVAESRSFLNAYTSPVVVGQVMSANDPNWSVFWSMGSILTNPVNASNLNVGKHVGEDPNKTRADETIGYIVIESGSGSIGGVSYEAALGSDTVRGYSDSPTPYTYTLSGGLSSVSAAAASTSGMDGYDGGWAVLAGSPALTTSSIGLYVNEDQLTDAEQNHVNEQVGYIVFE